MIGFDVKYDRELDKALNRRIEKGLFRSLGNAAAAIRSTARRLITRSKDPSAEGEPVHTRKGQTKRSDAILFAVDRDRDEAVIGFTHAVMGTSMAAHEHGGWYGKGDGRINFPARPTMGPALEVNLVRFADEFEGVLGGQ